MRKIRFRGKTQEGMWVMGYFVQYEDEAYIFPETEVAKGLDIGGYLDCCKMIQVIPETVGQFIGLCDVDGRMIFEGDILESPVKRLNLRFGNLLVITDIRLSKSVALYACDYRIVGNVHDDPELLKGE